VFRSRGGQRSAGTDAGFGRRRRRFDRDVSSAGGRCRPRLVFRVRPAALGRGRRPRRPVRRTAETAAAVRRLVRRGSAAAGFFLGLLAVVGSCRRPSPGRFRRYGRVFSSGGGGGRLVAADCFAIARRFRVVAFGPVRSLRPEILVRLLRVSCGCDCDLFTGVGRWGKATVFWAKFRNNQLDF